MYRLPNLPYDYDALEPHIDARTMEIHYSKHHAGYVDKLNKALEDAPDARERDIEELLRDLSLVPSAHRTAVRNNGGGHANHSLFWRSMSADGGGRPEGELASRIDSDFGDFETFKERFDAAATGRFGSGWAWLVIDGGPLSITSTPNQDSPLMEGRTPILGIDVWEHAYYLNYQNRRPDYVEAWWNVVDWQRVAKRLDKHLAAAAVA